MLKTFGEIIKDITNSMKNFKDMAIAELGTEYHLRLEIAAYSECYNPKTDAEFVLNAGLSADIKEVLDEMKLRK